MDRERCVNRQVTRNRRVKPSLVYLGSWFQALGSNALEIKMRLAAAWKRRGMYRRMLTSPSFTVVTCKPPFLGGKVRVGFPVRIRGCLAGARILVGPVDRKFA